MIIPQGKEGLNCSLRQLNLLLSKDMIVPQGKRQLARRPMNFLQGKAQVP